jgi:polysaccharide deacetylase 2 family uncharacterized protein YibQ
MARPSFLSRLKSLWHKASSSLLGLAALGLALGIGIGLGLWLGDVADPPQPPPQRAAPPSPAAPPATGAPRPAQPRIEIAPWLSDPRRGPAPSLDLPPEDPLRALPPDAAPRLTPPSADEAAPPQELQQDGALPPATPPDLPAWRRHALAAPATGGRAMVAIVIDDMGVDQRHSLEATALPGPLTLAYLPYARDVAAQAAAARRAGHELLVHVSMQPQSKTGLSGQAESGGDPGPNALTVGLPPEEIRRRLDWALGQFSGYVGINNHMGSAFTANRAGMSVVIGELKRRGLLFLDSRTTPTSVGETLAAEAGLPHATRHVFLDNIQTPAEVRARLAEVERIAKSRGSAVAIGHPHQATLMALRDWLPGAAGRGLALVPLSAIVAQGLDAPDDKGAGANAQGVTGALAR